MKLQSAKLVDVIQQGFLKKGSPSRGVAVERGCVLSWVKPEGAPFGKQDGQFEVFHTYSG